MPCKTDSGSRETALTHQAVVGVDAGDGAITGGMLPYNRHVMSTLFLIRHGQASFGSANYDRLSTLGERQVVHLREHLQDLDIVADRIYSGRLQRQQRTAEILADAQQTAITTQAEFDEYDAHSLLRARAERSGHVLQSLQSAAAPPDPRLFQRQLEEAGRAWVSGELDAAGVESWPAFRSRVASGIDHIMQHEGRGKTVLVCTSAGVIGAAMGHLLNLDSLGAIRLSWSVVNSSLTRIQYDDTRRSLASFNATPHLERAERRAMITYR